ncbi:alpha/beta fold hydrolase, partial [Nocardia wallacei]|uniref:alpha/beta fold hydrolase n=1 Tax=Nocardia wallacei TaxID=480035 RepID=UPI0024538421
MPVIEVPAGPVHYLEHGEGPPVVLLHGLLMNHTVWDAVAELLPSGFRYIRPDLPLGSHPEAMHADADLSMRGLNVLIADFLTALDLREVTLVHNDWGGGLFLTAYGLDERVSRLIVTPCEAFGNFPPGLPGKMAVVARPGARGGARGRGAVGGGGGGGGAVGVGGVGPAGGPPGVGGGG